MTTSWSPGFWLPNKAMDDEHLGATVRKIAKEG